MAGYETDYSLTAMLTVLVDNTFFTTPTRYKLPVNANRPLYKSGNLQNLSSSISR